MNSNSYRLVFNRARGALMAVGEGARSVRKSASGQGGAAVVMATLLLAGGSQAQIVADPNAPANQRPTVLLAPNGVPLVNIQTPSAAGVSRNTYGQFDVNANGAILNNSRTDAQTQLGGWVQGNPWLATGSARVILNEVHSAHPSQLRGWVEVAGQRAEVVIANPAGIQVSGAGFINAAGVTLTTGAPVFNGGSLESYRVQGGQVQISGNGLDTRSADHTAILARAVEVNAGLWANRLNVVTGANGVDATTQAPTGTATPSGSTPAFALDVAQLGGMYAGQIHLIGTEAGVGVNNRGVMAATAGNLVLDANGHLSHTGVMQASGSLAVQIQGDATLSGNTHAGQSLTVHAAGVLGHQGRINALGDVSLQGQQVHNSGEVLANAAVHVAGVDTIVNHGTVASATDLSLSAPDIRNSGDMRAPELALHANALDNRGGTLLANELSIDSDWVDNSQAGHMLAQSHLDMRTGGLDNRQGQVHALGNLVLDLRAGTLHNQGGVLRAAQTLTLSDGGQIANTGGVLVAEQDVNVHTRQLGLDGLIAAGHDANLTLAGDHTVDASGQLLAGHALEVTVSGTLTNRGVIDGGGDTRIRATSVHNTGTGRVYGDHIGIQATHLLNDSETVNAARHDAVIAARERLDIGAQHIVNRDGALLFSAGSLHVGATLDSQHQASGSAQSLHNRSAVIESLGNMVLDTRELHNLNDHYAMQLEPGAPTPVLYLLHDGVAYTQDQLGLNFPALNQYEDQAGWSVLLPSAQYPFSRFPADVSSWARPTWFGRFTVDINHSYTRVGSGKEAYTIPHPYPRDHGIWGRFGVAPPPAQPAYSGPQCGSEHVYCNATQWGQYNEHQADMAVYNTQHSAAVQTLNQHIDAYNASVQARTLINWTVIDASQTVYTPVVSQSAPAQIRVGGNLKAHFETQALNDKSQILVGGTASLTGAALQNIEAQGTELTAVRGNSVYSYYHEDCDFCDDDRYYEFTAYAADTTRTVTVPITRFQTQVGAGSGANAGAHTAQSNTGAIIGSSTIVPPPLAVQDLASSSLFTLNPASTSGYLIETDPRFTDRRQWLGSDYLLAALSYDPASVHKRLGDGFYEQQLIREQVAQLTGQRFLGDHTNDDAQYRALMDAGVTFAQAHPLRPGVALTADQVAALTSDIVWLVEREVSLGDGRTVKALVPQVYVVPRAGDLNGSGTLIAAQAIDIQLSGDLVNSGTIAGRQITRISAENLHNLGGTISAQDTRLQARLDLANVGGTLAAQDRLVLQAGRDLNLVTTTASTDTGTSTRTTVDRVAALYVSQPDGVLVASAGGDMNLSGALIDSQGTTQLIAAGDVRLQTVRTDSRDTMVWDAHNRLGLSQSQEVGTRIQSQGDLTVMAGQDIQARAASVQAQGELRLSAGRDIGLEAGQASQGYDEAHRIESSGFLSSQTTTTRDSRHDTFAQASELGGRTVSVQAGQDVKLTGSQLISDAGTTVVAGRDIELQAAQTRHSESHFQETSKSGLGAMGGLSYGKSQHSTDQQVVQTASQASTVGAIAGDVTLVAGQSYRQSGSDVLAPGGDVNILAKDIAIVEARETQSSRTEERFKSSGISVSVGSPILSAAQTTTQMASAIQKTDDGRMQALGVAAAGLNIYNSADEIGKAAKALANGDLSQAGSISISLGSSKSESLTETRSDSAKGSTVLAGGSVNLIASGAAQDSGILVRGSAITAGDTARLMADGDITLQAARNDREEHSRQKSSSASVGVSVSAAGPTGVTVSASQGKGQGDGFETTYTNTHVNAGNLVVIDSGADTTLKGATAQAEQIIANVGGNLSIESLQDSATYNERSKNAGVSVTFGPSPGGSISAGKTKIDSDYRSVTERSGLKAGDGGFQVVVNGHTDLKGGAITSTEPAVQDGKNRFESGSLSTSDLSNTAHYKANGYQVGIGVTNGKLTGSLGVGSDKGDAQSTTQAAISGLAGNQGARTGDAETGIATIFDKERVKDDINAQVTITAAFVQESRAALKNHGDQEREKLKARAEQATTDEERAEIEAQLKSLDQQDRVINLLISAVAGLGISAVAQEGLAAAADQMRQLMIEDSRTFAGVVDSSGRTLDNISGESEGVEGDAVKLGGTRVDLDALCGSSNERCRKNPDGSLALNDQGQVVFTAGDLADFLKTPEGKKMIGPTGGIQGMKGTLFGFPYEAGSWQDKLIEAFAGPHDYIGGSLSGLYDEQGNARRGMTDAERRLYDNVVSPGALVPATPFAAAQVLPRDVWLAISILLGAGR